MDPDLFNSLSGIQPLQPYNTSVIDDTSPNDLTLSSIDASTSPSSMPGLGSGMGVLGSFLGAYGDIIQGQEQQKAYEYNADLALQQGQFDLDKLEASEHDTLSTQKAMYAKAGVTMSGSPLDTALNTASQFEMDKQITNYNTQSKANMDIYKGKVAKQQSEFKAGMAILSGVTDLAFAMA